MEQDGRMEKSSHSPNPRCRCLRRWLSRRGVVHDISVEATVLSLIFQASEVEEEESEVPEESFTSTKEFKVNNSQFHQTHLPLEVRQGTCLGEQSRMLML